MYAGPAGMEKLALDLETGEFEQTKVIPGKAGQAMNRTYLNRYIRQCMLVAGVDVITASPEDFEWSGISLHHCCMPCSAFGHILLSCLPLLDCNAARSGACPAW